MRLLKLVLLGILATLLAGAATIDFEAVPLGTYSQLVFPDLRITYTGGQGLFDVESQNPGPPISGHALISYHKSPGAAPFRVDFLIGGVNHFMIGVGDYNADIDNTYLQVYDALGNLLASDYYQNPANVYGGDYLEVNTVVPIAYALFWDAEPFPGAVYWDNLTYDTGAVPEPGTFLLAGGALLGLALLRRKS